RCRPTPPLNWEEWQKSLSCPAFDQSWIANQRRKPSRDNYGSPYKYILATLSQSIIAFCGQPIKSCTSMARESVEKMVAVIDDDERYRCAVQRLLKSAGFSVQSFGGAEAFLNSGRQHETGCLITDIR